MQVSIGSSQFIANSFCKVAFLVLVISCVCVGLCVCMMANIECKSIYFSQLKVANAINAITDELQAS